MNDGTAEALENTAEIVEGAAQIQIGDVHVPMLMRPQGRANPLPFWEGSRVPARETAGSMEHPPDGSRADGHDIGIEHHKRQAAITLQRILVVEVQDGLCSHGSNQKSRGIQALCSLTRP